MNILITLGIILVLLIAGMFVTQDMAIRITALKYNKDPKELKADYKKWKEEKRDARKSNRSWFKGLGKKR